MIGLTICSLKQLPRIFATLVVVLSLLVFTVWQFDLVNIKNAFPDKQISNPVTALCFIFLAVALPACAADKSSLNSVGKALALVVFTIGTIVFFSITLQFNTSIDKWLYTDKLYLYGNKGKPNYMAPNTAFCFMLAGVFLTTCTARRGFAKYLADIMALLCLLIAFTSLLGYFYGADEFYNFKTHIPMAFPTAVSFFLIAFANLLTRTHFGMLGVFTEHFTGSGIIRWLVPLVILLPCFLGTLRLRGEELGLFSR